MMVDLKGASIVPELILKDLFLQFLELWRVLIWKVPIPIINFERLFGDCSFPAKSLF